LKRLQVKNLSVSQDALFFDKLLNPLKELTHLDMSGAFHKEGMGDFGWLLNVKQLVSLTLNDVQGLEDSLDILCQLQNLQHLDISRSDNTSGHFKNPKMFLQSLSKSLKKLKSLDISGTNLVAPEVELLKSKQKCNIPGLTSRLNDPLDFLGLYKTLNEACSRELIPATSISGDSSETQILVAGKRYLDRPKMLENVLADLYNCFKQEDGKNWKEAMNIVLLSLQRHSREPQIQIYGTAFLYMVIREETGTADWDAKVTQKILSTLIQGLENNMECVGLVNNVSLILCTLPDPREVVVTYEILVKMVLKIMIETIQEADGFPQKVFIHLVLNLQKQKELLGNMGVIEKMLLLTSARLEIEVYDDYVLENALIALWSLTDECSINCERFTNCNGLSVFLKLKDHIRKTKLLPHFLGVFGNVAEVPFLRRTLMNTVFVQECIVLLDMTIHGHDVSAGATKLLVSLVSDGAHVWTLKQPEWNQVLICIADTINTWDIKLADGTAYTALTPIIYLGGISKTPVCQLWAVWKLANLTTLDPKRYCQMVLRDGGLILVEELLNEYSGNVKTSLHKVKELAEIVR